MSSLALTRLGGPDHQTPGEQHDPEHLRLEHHATPRPQPSNMVTTCRIHLGHNWFLITATLGPSLNIKWLTLCVQSLRIIPRSFSRIKNQIQIIGPQLTSYKSLISKVGLNSHFVKIKKCWPVFIMSKQSIPFAFRLDDLIIQISWKVLHNSKRHDDDEELYKKSRQPLNDLKRG